LANPLLGIDVEARASPSIAESQLVDSGANGL
jgi:hypothetical protein